MAVETVAETPNRFGYEDVVKSLRKIAQAVAVLKSVRLAIDAQEDGSVRYQDNGFSRWGPAVDFACSCLREVRDISNARLHTTGLPEQDWWTPLTLMEAMGASLWHAEIGTHRDELEADELQSCSDAAIESLGRLYESLGIEADRLEPKANMVTAES